ncbi:hypothetical protein PLICRDRAFT_53266 [Plicaturopsis crispa FD-325 SS-3]|nr:hypothetical protein PLICRDRAFT_53266 [Plicaturopsis crispa FD-325 SS-3]
MPRLSDYIVTGLLLLSALYVWRRRAALARNPRGLPLPPGPRGLPVIKNLLQWPQGNAWRRFSEWRKVYGDVFHLEMMGQHVIVLNTLEATHDTLEQSKYADRPAFTMAGELMGFSDCTILAPYGEYWKFLRRLTHQAISKTAASRYWLYHEKDARIYVRHLLEHPTEYREALRYLTNKNILKTSYGLEIDRPDHEYITLSEITHHDLSHALIPGSFLVDIVPFLKHIPSWLPGAGFQNHAARSRVRAWKMADRPYLEVKKAFESGVAPPSFVSTLLEQEKDTTYDADKWASFSSMSTFFLAMAMFPEVQKKAQEEIDRVVGTDRLPALTDRDSMPYMEALVKETIRWHPPLPTGLAHRSMEDQYYNDYYIPKDAVVMPNVWEMAHDPENYPDPKNFKPERYLGTEQGLDPYSFCFGFGRRNCPGVHYATSILYIVMTSVLAAFDISVEDGVKLEYSEDLFSPKFISYAEAFPCRITPRSSTLSDVLQQYE